MAAMAIGLFVFLAGLCVGSFLNVVIYRLPRDLSISKPTWSFCPHCQATLRWHDNIPVLSWLLLRARCRRCHKPISAQYPLVEAITGLAFVLTYYVLFVGGARVGADHPAWPTDVPLLLAWLVLVAALMACSTLDLVSYMVDTRVTDVAIVAGIMLCALWPRPEFFAARAATPAAAAATVAFIVTGLMLWRSARRDLPTDQEETEREAADAAADARPASPSSTTQAATVVSLAAFLGLAVWLLVAASGPASSASGVFRLAVPTTLLALFAAMVLAGGQPRQADDELRAAIEAEAPAARGTAIRELLWLAPAIVTAIVAYVAVDRVPAIASLWQGITSWAPVGRFTPGGGVAFAIHGVIVAATAGWIIRIFFTLAFGREAFGVGDIYILAAAGAVGGWDIALLGFLLSVPIALLGWIISLLLKRSGMIPFGPPMAIGFLAALWLNRQAAGAAESYYQDLVLAWRQQPQGVLLGVGLLLVALPVSIVLARLVRRLVEPK